MDPRNRRPTNGLADGRTTPLPDADEFDHRIRRSTTTTHSKKTVTRRSVAGGNNFNYDVDLWESTPKTDYTYSRSRSYLRQPTNENYVSPNMSRRSLRGNSSRYDEHSSGVNLTSWREEGGSGMGSSTSSSISHEFTSTSREEQEQRKEEQDLYMTLRSRTLMSHRMEPAGWKNDNTFQMRSMHGTDTDEEIIDSMIADRVVLGNHGNHAGNDGNTVVNGSHTFSEKLASFLVTLIQICVTTITYFPKKAVTFFSKLSSAAVGDESYRSTTRQQRETVTVATETTTTVETDEVAVSKWVKMRDSVCSVVVFLLWTLPVGLVSWIVYGVIAAVKVLRRSSGEAWHAFETLLYLAVTKSSRVADTRVLSRTSSLRRRCGCCCLFPLLFLLPLLFIGLLYGVSCQKDAAILDSMRDQFIAYLPSLNFKSAEKDGSAVVDNLPPVIVPEVSRKENLKSVVDNELSIDVIDQRINALVSEFLAGHQVALQADQKKELDAFQLRIDDLVKRRVQDELGGLQNTWNVQINTLRSAANDNHLHVLGEQQNQTAAIESLQSALNLLAAQLEELSNDLIRLNKTLAERPASSEPQFRPDNDRRIEELKDHMRQLNLSLIDLKANYETLSIEASKWPTDEHIKLLINTRIREYFTQIMSELDPESSIDLQGRVDQTGQASTDGKIPFGLWLSRQFTSKGDLDRRLDALAVDITKEVNEVVSSTNDPEKLAHIVTEIIAKSEVKVAAAEETIEKDGGVGGVIVGTSGATSDTSGAASGAASGATSGSSAPCMLCDGALTKDDVLNLIKVNLGIYDADKTGKVDYALESAGGSVISVRCSETYQLRTAQTSLWGIPLYYTYNSPRVVIQPGMHPGECWPFTGRQGYVVVQLSREVFISEVSIEHIPKSLAPSGNIDSAPKDCELWGLESETDMPGTFLGSFTYRNDGDPLQTFKMKDPKVASFKFVELKILSNHGNEHYTCLYRLRVHGSLDRHPL